MVDIDGRLGAYDLKEDFPEDGKVFSNPKPVRLLAAFSPYLLKQNGDLAVDFFAGSGASAKTIYELNFKDSIRRRFVLVQLPEPLDIEDKDQKIAAKFCDKLGKPRTISELTKERIRRAGNKVREKNPMFAGDLGFRVFKLDTTNICTWDPDRENLSQTLLDSVEHLKAGRSESDVLYELLLKLGLDLCVPMEQKTIAGKVVHSIGAGTLLVCLSPQIAARRSSPWPWASWSGTRPWLRQANAQWFSAMRLRRRRGQDQPRRHPPAARPGKCAEPVERIKSMSKDLTNSALDRQNILNNPYAVAEIEKAVGIHGIPFEGKTVVLKEQVAAFFEVTPRTIDNYIEKYSDELRQNGYEVLRGNQLKELKIEISKHFGHEMDFATKTTVLGIFDFRAFLNLSMLIVESERARLLRRAILDIVIDTINQRTGGGTKYINQRDEEFLQSWFEEENYRRQFTDALRDCVDMGNFKYPLYTDKIYVSIFREKATEYRKVLRLQEKDKVRDTFYAEVLDLVAAYESGFADVLQRACAVEKRKLTSWEADSLFADFENQALWKPLIEKARNKMASRDLAFRDALHLQLKEYVTPLQRDEFERFLGEKSKELAERLEDAKDVMKRLKERE